MENATEAFKMAFAMLVFVVALSLTMYSFSRVRQASATVTQEADMKEYYDKLSLAETEGIEYSTSSRIVGVETVIPTLYRYYKENYTIVFYKAIDYNVEDNSFSSLEPIILYYTETDSNYLKNSSLLLSDNSTIKSGRAVFGLDKQDEQVRNEPWCASEKMDYDFIKSFVNGIYTNEYYTSKSGLFDGSPNKFVKEDKYYQIRFNLNSVDNFDTFKGLIGQDYKFIERFGEYNYDNVLLHDDEDNPTTEIQSNITDSVIELDNGEIISKRNQTKKRVLQYILIN